MSDGGAVETATDGAGQGAPGDDGAGPAGAEAPVGDEGLAYRGLPGAYPYAFRESESRLLRSYVVVGGLVAVLVGLLFLLALPGWVANTLRGSATATLSRVFLVLVGLSVFAPLVAPVLLVARHHRRDGSDPRYDAAMAAAGYLFVAGTYAGLVIGAPGQVVPDQYRAAGVAPPVVAVLLLLVAHRRLQ
jgi:uncharacterized membrane protein YuzA (DUF378 family)